MGETVLEGNTLATAHREMLAASCISPETIKARGYFTVTKKGDLERLGFGENQRHIPGLLIPVWSVAGEVAGYQFRSDRPRLKDGKPVKYEMPRAARMALDVPPEAREALGDPATSLYITEGIKKADAAVGKGLCCIALLGVWNWRGKNDDGGLTALADWESIALNQRRVFICFDSDVMEKREVHSALSRLKRFLESRKAVVRVIYLPSSSDGKKVGLDDYFAAGWDADHLLELATDKLKEAPPDPDSEAFLDELEHLTDSGAARHFAKLYGSILKFVPEWGWVYFDSQRWNRKAKAFVKQCAKGVAKYAFELAGKAPDDLRKQIGAWALKLESEKSIRAVISLAESEPEILASADQFDRDPQLLTCENGTVDLKTGILREHRPGDFITRLCPFPFEPEAKRERWDRFIREVMGGNQPLAEYLQRVCGYALTGDMREQCFWIAWGEGGNGKNKLYETLRYAFGADYATEAPSDILIADRPDSHPTGLADLAGKRFVVTSESDSGKKLAEALVKSLTGDRKRKARFMRADYFEFEQEYKLWLVTNHKPDINPDDDAIWDRVRLIPFNVRFRGTEREDKTLDEKLRAEAPGILAWAVEGAVAWYAQGLCDPPEVKAAIQEYRQEQDILHEFISEACVTGEHFKAKASALFEAYLAWHRRGQSGDPLSKTGFGKALSKKGFTRDKSGVIWWLGIGLKEGESND